MAGTDELRRLLDERGVRHFDGDEMTCWGFEDEFTFRYSADEVEGGIQVTMCVVTPAQAVEATLGRGTCEWQLVKSGPCYLVCRCSVCGYEHAESMTDKGATDFDPSFCPNCGREVVAE